MPLHPEISLNAPSEDVPRKLVGREATFVVLLEAASSAVGRKYRVMNLHGVAGVGKSRTCREFGTLLDELPNGSPWALVNLEQLKLRESPSAALFHMRNELKRKYRFSFPTFDLAYAVYWQKVNPQVSLTRRELPFVEEGDLLAEIVELVREVPGLGLVTKLPSFIHRSGVAAQRWWTERGQRSLVRLPELESFEIERRLPAYWALDLQAHAAELGRPVVLILDGYEALWTDHPAEGGRTQVDAWVREWVLQLPGVCWIIAGRERLAWNEVDVDWGGVLQYHALDGLRDEDAGAFLSASGVDGEDVRSAIVTAARGNPFYLNLAVDAHEDIARNRRPSPGDFGETPFKLVERFTRYLTDSQLGTLEVLAVPNGWDAGMFASLVRHFETGYPVQQHGKLARYSFIVSDPATGRHSMHGLMRQALLDHPRFADVPAVHRFLYDHYRGLVEGVTLATGTLEHVKALSEALHHGHLVTTESELRSWFTDATEAFDTVRFAAALLPLHQRILGHALAAHGPYSLEVADSFQSIGYCLSRTDRPAEAEGMHRRALENRLLHLPPNHMDVGWSQLALGWALCNLDQRHESAERAAAAEAAFAAQQTDGEPEGRAAKGLSSIWELLGTLRSRENRWNDADAAYERALHFCSHDPAWRAGLLLTRSSVRPFLGKETEALREIQEAMALLEERYGSGSVRAADARFCLALALNRTGNPEEAERLLDECLAVYRAALGPQSTQTAAVLSVLAGVRSDAGSHTESLQLLDLTLTSYRATYGDRHLFTAGVVQRLASDYSDLELVREKAIPLLQEAWQALCAGYGEESPEALTMRVDLANAWCRIGDTDQAARILEQVAAPAAFFPANAVLQASIHRAWSSIEERRGRYASAEAHGERACEIYEASLPATRWGLASALHRLGELYTMSGRLHESTLVFERAIALKRGQLGDHHVDVCRSVMGLAAARWKQGDYPGALGIVEEVLAGGVLNRETLKGEYQESRLMQGILLLETGRPEEAGRILRDVYQEWAATEASFSLRLLMAAGWLAHGLCRAGDAAEAAELCGQMLDRGLAAFEAGTYPALPRSVLGLYEALIESGEALGDVENSLAWGFRTADRLRATDPEAGAWMHVWSAEYLGLKGRHAESIALLRTARAWSSDSPDPELRHRIARALAHYLGQEGLIREAVPELVATLAAAEEAFGPASEASARACELLAEAHAVLGEADDALQFAARCLTLREAAPSVAPAVLARTLKLDATQRFSRESARDPEALRSIESALRRADSLFREATEDCRGDHAGALVTLAHVLDLSGQMQAARDVLVRVLDMTKQEDLKGIRAVAVALLGDLHAQQADAESHETAEVLFRDAERLRMEAGDGTDSYATRIARGGIVSLFALQGRFDEMEREACSLLDELEGSSAALELRQDMLLILCKTRLNRGQGAAAADALEQLLAFARFEIDNAPFILLTLTVQVVTALTVAGDGARARALFDAGEQALTRTDALPPDYAVWVGYTNVRLCLFERNADRADALLEAYLEACAQGGVPVKEVVADTMDALAALQAERGRVDREAHWYQRCWETHRALRGASDEATVLAAQRAGRAALRFGRPEAAEATLRAALEADEASLARCEPGQDHPAGLHHRRAVTLFLLGTASEHSGDLPAALALFEASQAALGESGLKDDVSTAELHRKIDMIHEALSPDGGAAG